MKELKLNLTPLIRKLDVFSRRGLTGSLAGEYRSAFKGTGLEFDRYRKYDPSNDDARKIDWKASLRARMELVREFVEERNIQVIVMLDVSSTMSFGSTGQLKNEYAAELFASMAFAMIRTGDSVGLAMFNDHMGATVLPSIGTAQFYLLMRTLKKPENYEGNYDLAQSLRDVAIWQKKRGTLVIISDFIGWKKEWLDDLRIAGAMNDLIGIMVRDPRDVTMPDAHLEVVVKDPHSSEDVLIDTKLVKKEYEDLAKGHEQMMKESFELASGDFMSITTDQPFKDKLTAFFKERTLRMGR